MPFGIGQASCAGVLAVGGTEPDGNLWPGSTREPYVAVAAPGDHMVYVGRDGRFTTTGADRRLTGTATPAGHPVPNDGYGYGIVNPARAVNTGCRRPVRRAVAGEHLATAPAPAGDRGHWSRGRLRVRGGTAGCALDVVAAQPPPGRARPPRHAREVGGKSLVVWSG
jgi:hypothetical protein